MSEATQLTKEDLTAQYKAKYPETKKRYEQNLQRIAERSEWLRVHPGHEDAPKIRVDIEALTAENSIMLKELLDLLDLMFES
jgi:hypothetical protein